MKASTMTRDEIHERKRQLEDSIEELQQEVDELEAALIRDLHDPDSIGKLLVGPLCLSCKLNDPEFGGNLCEDCAEKARQLLGQGIPARSIAMGQSALTNALERMAVQL